jgi:hypothetical protein
MTGSAVTPKTGSANNAGCLILMGAFFAFAGLFFGLATLFGAKGFEDPSKKMTGLVGPFVFLCAGAGLMAWGASRNRTAKRLQEMKVRAPDKPWMWRDDWAQGYAKPDWQSEAATRGIAGVVIVLVSGASAAGAIIHPPRHLSYLDLVVLLFPLGGLVLIGQSILIRLRERKFRQARLIFSTLPGVIGGRLQGRLESAFPFPGGSDIHLALSCVRSSVSGSGDSRSRWERVLWQVKSAVMPYAGTPASFVPVDFTIPYDTSETDGSNPDTEVFWRLTASAVLPGLDFRARFRVPVFKTATSDPSITTESIDAAETTHLAGSKPNHAKIIMGASNEGGVQFHLGPARNKGIAAAFTLFGIVFFGAGIFWSRLPGNAFKWFAGIPLLICAAVGLVLLLVAFSLWFGQTDIKVVSRSLRIRSSCLGFSSTRSVNAGEIQRFELYPAMQQGDQVWYDLRLHLSNGGTVTAGSGIEKSEAEWFQSELRKDLGL